ncbi:hypothetical protein PIIN_10294 [Serendipita indica DSM 11827]|uniref:F-box domain-containing protein n=1 Tax=Serendipita indica (strain DSM 11827) TaxID=1109443 RepID=G4TYA6_SERID|nr:hypothetical protein PIIN_10294 [Serendipita indica DSM 11827]
MLPSELLLEIFAHYLCTSGHQAIANLLLVCKRWARLVMNSPQIWARIEVELHIGRDEDYLDPLRAYVAACMKWSRGLPLPVALEFETVDKAVNRIHQLVNKSTTHFEKQDLHVRDMFYLRKLMNISCRATKSKSTLRPLSDMMGPHGLGIARWRDFTVILPDHPLDDVVHDQFRFPAPNITNLSVQSIHGYSELPSSFPAGVSLEVKDCDSLSCLQVNLNLLQRLLLFYEQALHTLGILSACRALQILEIDTNRGDSHDDSESMGSSQEIFLPNLRNLTLGGAFDPFSTHMIKFPALEKVTSYLVDGWDV